MLQLDRNHTQLSIEHFSVRKVTITKQTAALKHIVPAQYLDAGAKQATQAERKGGLSVQI